MRQFCLKGHSSLFPFPTHFRKKKEDFRAIGNRVATELWDMFLYLVFTGN